MTEKKLLAHHGEHVLHDQRVADTVSRTTEVPVDYRLFKRGERGG